MPENPTSEKEREFNPELHKEALSNLNQNFNLDNISKNFSNIQETIDPYNPGIRQQKEIDTDVEFDQGAFYDFASGFWNSFVVGTAEGVAALPFTIANAVQETEFANDWIEKVNKVADNFEYVYSDDYYKPIEKFGDITSSHFWAGLGNGIGFVAGIGKFAKAGQLIGKGGRSVSRARKAILEADPSSWYKAGATARNEINKAANNIFKSSKAGKVSNKIPKFKKVDPVVKQSMQNKLAIIQSRAEKSLKSSARIGSFLGGTTMMYNMVQDEAREAGLDPTSSARFALGVASVVSLTEGAALEWIGKIPARTAQRALIKAASKKAFKSAAKKTPNQLMDSFLPIYSKGLKALNVVEGAAIEFGQEFGQTYIEEGAKQMYDEMFAKDEATVGKGKFGTEVFDLEADSIGEFFTDGKDSKKTFTNSVFAGILGGIIGGGMAGMRLNAVPGERNVGNESMFNLVVDDVSNKKTTNRENIKEALDKALKSENISQKDYNATNELIDEMASFVERSQVVKIVSDPVAQYQMFNLDRAYKNVQSKTLTEEEVREKAGDAIDAQVEESVKINKEKNKLFEILLDAIGINSAEILRTGKSETKNPNEFNDKMNAYEAISVGIESGAITTKEELNEEIDKVYKSEFKKEFIKGKKRGKALGEIEKEEYNRFKKDGVISQDRINYLASKLIDEQEFTEQEQEMFDTYEKEVNEAKDKFVKEDKESAKEKTKPEETKEEKPEEKETEVVAFQADIYAESLKGYTTEEQLKEEEENIKGDPNQEEKQRAIDMQRIANNLAKPTEAKEKKKEESKPTEEKTTPNVYKTATSLRQAQKEESLTEDDIRETYNRAKTDLKAGKNRKSANAIINEIEKKARKEEKYLNAIKPKKDEKTEGSKETDKDSKEETKVEAEEQEVLEEEIKEVEVEEIKPTTKETTDIVKIEKETSVEVLREYDNAEINAIARNTNNEAVEGLGQLISKDVKEVEGGKAEQEVYQYGVIQRITSEDGSKIQRVTDHYGKVYGIPIINLTMDAKEAGFFFDGKKDFSLTREQITDFFNSKFGKPKTGGVVEVETNENVGDINTGVSDIDTVKKTATEQEIKNAESNNKQNTEEAQVNKDEIINKPSEGIGGSLSQRKGLASKFAESQKIADNLELYEKIKGHFKKMFPNIPVSTVDMLFDKYGAEVLGKVSEKGITISDQAFQSTLVHEFAHVYLDLIADKEIVDLALDWIKTTQYFTDAKRSYPNDTGRTQSMEALVQAMSENAIPKLEERLSDSQITKWMSIAKKLWRAIKRMFTGYKPSSYVDYLADSLVFNNKPIMVDTSYLSGVEKYERKAISVKDANFNSGFLLKNIKRFAINSLHYQDVSFGAADVLGNVKKMISDKLESGNFVYTDKLNTEYENLKANNEEFNEVKFNDLSFLNQTEILLKNAMYDEGISYQDHINSVVEYLAVLPTESVNQVDINEAIKREQKTESETGKIEKEAIKGSKKMNTSINALLARLVDSNGDRLHQDDVFAYLTDAAMKSSTVDELKARISEDSKIPNNDIPFALFNTLVAVKDYDEQFGTSDLQTILNQALSNQSIPQKSIVIEEDEKGFKSASIFSVSKSKKRQARTFDIKQKLTSEMFRNLPLVIPKGGDVSSVKRNISHLLENLRKSKNPTWGFQLNEKTFNFDINQVNRLGNFLLDRVDDFTVDQYINWLIDEQKADTKINNEGGITKRAKALQDIRSETDAKKREVLSMRFFMADVLNTAAEQLDKTEGNKYYDKFSIKNDLNKKIKTVDGKVNALMNFASFTYDRGLDNANMFINSSGNTVSTIRYGSYLNRTFADAKRHSAFAKEKYDKKVRTKNGDVYLWRSNPVFNSVWETGEFNWMIDDAVNYKGDVAKEHSKLSAVDLILSQLMFFSNDQNRTKYYQKAMINDRSHSNYIQVNRLDNDAVKNQLNEQRRVDEYFLNEGYKKLKTKEQKELYLKEFNVLSLNFAYDVDGTVVVKNFDPIFLQKKNREALDSLINKDKSLNEIEKKGITQKVLKINKEVKELMELVEKTGLIETVKKDHVNNSKIYKTYQDMMFSFVLNERINRLAINDIISEPIARRLIKKGKVDKSNILKRNSGFDSTGLRVDLSDKKTMTVVYEMPDKEGNPISDSFLWRSKSMTEAIQKQLGDEKLDPISYNSKDGEYMINAEGENIYHKNSSVNYFGNEENNNIVEMAKAMMPDSYEQSNYYRISKMLEMLEKKYPDKYIQIIDKDAIKGSKADINAMKVEDLYNAISNNEFDKINNSKYEYTSQNFYIPFNENKEAKKLNSQFAKLSTQAVKIWTNNTNQDNALLESKELEGKIVDYLLEQMGVESGNSNYLESREVKKLFNTQGILQELLNKVDDLQDPDTAQLLKDIIKYNKEEGAILDKARKTKNRLENKEDRTEEENQRLQEAEDTLKNKSTINKIDHPAMTPQLKQVILSKLEAVGLDVRVPGAYLKMVPDMDNRLKANEIIVPYSMFGQGANAREQAEKFLKEQNEKGGLFIPGVRVPASDAISTLNARVVGFIEGDSNVAILPHSFTIKSDADHDGDKVFLYKPDVKIKDGKTVINENSKANEIYKTVDRLSKSNDYNNRIEKGTIDLNEFTKLVDEIDTELKEGESEGLLSEFDFGSVSEMSATDARMSFGETAVGILAVAGKLNSALYQANTRFREETKRTIDGKTYNLVGVGVNEYDKTSNDIAMLLQGALDMSANPVLLRSGIDGKNINVVVAMLISGIPLKTVIKFINKPEIKDYYLKDQTQHNAFNKSANKSQFEESLAQKIKDEEGKGGSRTDVKQNLENLQYFSQLSQELNAVTSVVQLDGGLPNDGYMLRDVKTVFNTIKNKDSKTKLNYRNFSQQPINKHYESIIDAAIGLMSHHFITENENYYNEIKKIEQSRKYSDVKQFDPSVEKRRVDDLFSLMMAQNLLDESQISDIIENGVEGVVTSLKDTVLESIEYSYKKIVGDTTMTDFVDAMLEDVSEISRTVEEREYNNNFSRLAKNIKVDGADTNLGTYIESVLQEKEFDINSTTKFLQENIKEKVDKDLVKLVNDYKQYKEFKADEILSNEQQLNNKFIKLLQLRSVKDEETGEQIDVLSGKGPDIRFLTTTEKQLAKNDFQKLPYEIQNRFLAYQLFKFGLSNKLGSIISIMPNEFTLDYLKNISNIDSILEKEKKRYKLDQYRISQSYNDLNYPVKQYEKVILKEEGGKMYAYNERTYGEDTMIPGKEGVRFRIKGKKKLYQFKEVPGTKLNEVKEIKSFAAERTQYGTVFNNEGTINLKEGEDLKNECLGK